ncbi:hypothetical protein N7462_010014 [Penicillium macrosclerotiorum]|uniref:uncharacterized protein n=1 Tax=Penicillium macrosclerotiorum TaxID=303699 RepID=UPI002547CA4F|nr:uncharacterized protein N7462_010014 [Penicillium macrosclerotiorum]KAJ5668944.1 hypothetical protein N7462_010014 [Penicillium macrosclerotiorum]
MRSISVNLYALLFAWATLVTCQDAVITSANAASTGESGQCANQQLVDQCVATMKMALAKCSSENWDCKCSGSANIANCYENCPNTPEYIEAQLLSEHDCATANAYDKGITAVTQSWTTPGVNVAKATPTDSDSTTSATDEPTKSLEQHEETKTSEGAAAAKTAGSWLALLGLGIGVMF